MLHGKQPQNIRDLVHHSPLDRETKRLTQTFLTLTFAILLFGAISVLAFSGTAAADQHTLEEAPTYSTTEGEANFTINLPERTDHYPGDHPVHSEQNGYNASIEYSATGEQAFVDGDATEGLWLDYIQVSARWIDYSQCDATENTKVFGIDRGNNNSGTRVDEDLIEHRRGSTLFDGGLKIQLFDWGDLAGDPPYLGQEDAIVAAQGKGSNAGPCLKMTSEPGWYQFYIGFTNGSVATKCKEEGNSQCEPDDKRFVGVNITSNYVYICECDSEQEARDKLGPPPSEDGGSNDGSGEATPSPTETAADDDGSTPTPTDAPGTPTPTEAPDTQTPTATTGGGNGGGGGGGGGSGGGPTQTQTQAQANDPGGGGGGNSGTPTISDGPGFTPLVALVALLGAALLVLRRP